MLHSEHELTVRLLSTDRKRIDEAGRDLVNFPEVSMEEYLHQPTAGQTVAFKLSNGTQKSHSFTAIVVRDMRVLQSSRILLAPIWLARNRQFKLEESLALAKSSK